MEALPIAPGKASPPPASAKSPTGLGGPFQDLLRDTVRPAQEPPTRPASARGDDAAAGPSPDRPQPADEAPAQGPRPEQPAADMAEPIAVPGTGETGERAAPGAPAKAPGARTVAERAGPHAGAAHPYGLLEVASKMATSRALERATAFVQGPQGVGAAGPAPQAAPPAGAAEAGGTPGQTSAPAAPPPAPHAGAPGGGAPESTVPEPTVPEPTVPEPAQPPQAALAASASPQNPASPVEDEAQPAQGGPGLQSAARQPGAATPPAPAPEEPGDTAKPTQASPQSEPAPDKTTGQTEPTARRDAAPGPRAEAPSGPGGPGDPGPAGEPSRPTEPTGPRAAQAAQGAEPAGSSLAGPAPAAGRAAGGPGPQAWAAPSAVPLDQVAVTVARAARLGEDRISIRLHPADLGRVDVKLHLGQDGAVRATVIVERPETLDLLQRDARGLERALQEAGLKAESGSLSFGLRGDSQQGAAGRHQPGGPGEGPAPRPFETGEEPDPAAALALYRPVGAGRALDIRV